VGLKNRVWERGSGLGMPHKTGHFGGHAWACPYLPVVDILKRYSPTAARGDAMRLLATVTVNESGGAL